MDDEEVLRIESPDLYRLFKATRDVDKKMYAGLRKALRDAGGPIVEDVRREAMAVPSSGKHRGGVRAAIARGTSVGIAASSEKSAGIRIKTSAKGLPANKKPLVKAFNKESFRHPVFARKSFFKRSGSKWVQQPGHPYFGRVIVRHWDEVQEEVFKVYLETWESLD